MHVESLQLEHLFNHIKTSIDLPEAGVVVITGPNGGGKSSLIEAVSVACWGKTLRGSLPWSGGGRGVAAVKVRGPVWVSRSKTLKGSPKLTWHADKTETAYPTTTKAQAALEEHIGTFDVWRRCSVFSSADAAHFSSATDAERKRLLERILGLSVFDKALDSCKKQRRLAQSKVNTLSSDVAVFETKVEAEQCRVAEAKDAIARHVAPTSDGLSPSLFEEEVRRLSRMVSRAGESITSLTEERLSLTEQCAKHTERLGRLRKRAKLLQESTCPTCTQRIGALARSKLKGKLEADTRKAEETLDSYTARLTEVHDAAEEESDEIGELRSQLSTNQRNLSEAQLRESEVRRSECFIASQELVVQKAEAAYTQAQADLATAREGLELAVVELAELKATETALGLRGIRAQVLGKALSGIEGLTNAWLERLQTSIRVALKPYSTLRSGNVTDSIGLDVVEAGGGQGYTGASGGERRRIDIALLLALGEVASAACGAGQGTLWLDEVFDCIDDEGGADAVASALGTLASDRCVVVITHSEPIARKLSSVARLRISGGQLR